MIFKKSIWRETTVVAAGELICSSLMVWLWAMLGNYHIHIAWSFLAGSLTMATNHFFLSLTVSAAAERAAQGDISQAQKMIQRSSIIRLLVMGLVLLFGIQLGGNVIALVLPLAFARPILMLAAFFRKKDPA